MRNLGAWKNFSLALKGGWTGTIAGTIITSDPSQFAVPLSIINWNADVTLSDILITGVTGDGLTVSTKKNITLTRVQSNGSTTGKGAVLNNSTGTGTVTITSSQFNGNYVDGLDIISKGAITLNSLTADGNGNGVLGVGANLDNSSGSGAVTIISTTSNQFNANHLDGLDILSKGAITLNSLTANGNTGGDGVMLDNSAGTGMVSITSGAFNANGQNGLDVTSHGAITTKNLTANDNGTAGTPGAGASLINSVSASAQPVTVAGTNTFTGNFLDGLNVESNGLITVNSVTATGNNTEHQAPGPNGVFLTNSVNPGFNAGITITGTMGTNVIDGNYYDGLYVFSNGPISLNNIEADNNTNGVGAILSNNTASGPQPVTITGTNEFNGNGLGGLIVYSNGTITTNNLTVDGNGSLVIDNTGNGVYLDNCNFNGTNCVGFARPINVLGNNFFDGNFNDGLDVQSLGGVITVNNIEANGNGTVSLNGVGAYLANDNSTLQSAVNITSNNINGNIFTGNYDIGLEVFSNGAITINHVTADGTVNTSDNGFGAYLDNCDFVSFSCQAPAAQPVTLTGTNEFGGNASNGLVIESRGVITLNNVTADDNGITSTNHGVGAVLQNNFDNSTAGVTLKGANNFDFNYGTPITVNLQPVNIGGLAVLSKGVISASNLTADSNTHGDGVYLNNAYAGVSRAVTLTGINTFNTNAYDGLDIESFGNIAASDLNAGGNGTSGGGSGVLLINNYVAGSVLSKGTVMLTGTNIFTNNYDYGLEVNSNGAITIRNLTADSNTHSDGAYLDNSFAPTAQPITLTGSNTFNYNFIDGLTINSKGAITVSSLTAVGNANGYGAWIANNVTNFASNVTLSGSDMFKDNNYDGLLVTSFGAISMNTTSLSATGNGYGLAPLSGNGVYLDNHDASQPKPITVKGMSVFDNDHGTGIVMYSKGAITASNITSSNNQTGYGVWLFNDVSNAVGNVTLTGNNVFYGNWKDGLSVTSLGAITVSNIVANANGQLNSGNLYGIDLNNIDANKLGVTVSGTNVFDENWSGGLYVNTTGAIKINNVTAVDNTGDGATLDNSTGPSTASVTFTGTNFFDGNSGDGLNITSNGKVALTKINADGNSGDGLDVTTPLTLTLTCGSFTNNTLYGINLDTNGTTTIIGAVLSGNHPDDTINQTGGAIPVIVRNCTLP